MMVRSSHRGWRCALQVLIFCENKTDVDNIHEFLLLKGVRVCSVHGARGTFTPPAVQ